LLDERRRARSRPQLSAFGHGFVRMREDHRVLRSAAILATCLDNPPPARTQYGILRRI
jgi:hypothetical protein